MLRFRIPRQLSYVPVVCMCMCYHLRLPPQHGSISCVVSWISLVIAALLMACPQHRLPNACISAPSLIRPQKHCFSTLLRNSPLCPSRFRRNTAPLLVSRFKIDNWPFLFTFNDDQRWLIHWIWHTRWDRQIRWDIVGGSFFSWTFPFFPVRTILCDRPVRLDRTRIWGGRCLFRTSQVGSTDYKKKKKESATARSLARSVSYVGQTECSSASTQVVCLRSGRWPRNEKKRKKGTFCNIFSLIFAVFSFLVALPMGLAWASEVLLGIHSNIIAKQTTECFAVSVLVRWLCFSSVRFFSLLHKHAKKKVPHIVNAYYMFLPKKTREETNKKSRSTQNGVGSTKLRVPCQRGAAWKLW